MKQMYQPLQEFMIFGSQELLQIQANMYLWAPFFFSYVNQIK